MTRLFDQLSDPRYNRKRQVVTRPVNNRRIAEARQAFRASHDLQFKVEELQRLATEQAQLIESQREQLQIRGDAIQRQTEDIKRLDSELLWTRAALEESQKKVQTQSADGAQETGWQERYVRLQAETDNMRKRLEQRAKEDARDDRNRILMDMLPLADHLELALQHAGEQIKTTREGDSIQAFVGNIEATKAAFLSALKRYDIVPIDALGKPFDPTKHEAIGRLDDATIPVDSVAKVVQTGYMDGDRLLRPSLVMVSNG